jgi:glutathione S-transferase
MTCNEDKLEQNELRLYANKICPYCQRVQILLADAGIAHERTEVDFTVAASWMAELTPIGKIPILAVGHRIIFESSVILEYLNDSCGSRYLPQEILERATMRSLCAAIDRIHDDVRTYMSAKTEQEFDAVQKRIGKRLNRVVEAGGSHAFIGEKISMLGIYFAPLFVLLQTLSECTSELISLTSATARLSEKILNYPSVMTINNAHYQSRLLRFLLSADSHFSHNAEHLRNWILEGDGALELKAAGYLSVTN